MKNTRENDEYFYWLDSILNADDENLTKEQIEFRNQFLKQEEA
jgi:hypothetical protein